MGLWRWGDRRRGGDIAHLPGGRQLPAVITASNSAGVVTATTAVPSPTNLVTGLALLQQPDRAGPGDHPDGQAIGSRGNVTYTWAFGDGAVGAGGSVVPTPTRVGDYTAIVTASNSAGVVTATTAVTIADDHRRLERGQYSPTLVGQHDYPRRPSVTAGTT